MVISFENTREVHTILQTLFKMEQDESKRLELARAMKLLNVADDL